MTFTGTIAGGAGTGIDTLDYQLFTSPLTVDLGTIAADIEFVQGTTNASSTLLARNTTNTWTIENPSRGSVSSLGFNPIGFSNFDIFQGGSLDDTFVFLDGASFAGTIAGGAGFDQLDYQGFTSPVTVDLGTLTVSDLERIQGNASLTNTLIGANTINTWSIDALNQGVVNGLEFRAFSQLTGGNSGDVFTLNGGSVETIAGGDGNDSIIFNSGSANTIDGGLGTNNTFTDNRTANAALTISGDNQGSLDGTLPFTNIQSIQLGSGNDTITFTAGTIASVLAGDGNDQFQLQGGTPAFIDGQGGDNTLETLNGMYTLTGANAGNVGGVTLFNSVQNLIGGSGDETVTFLSSGSLTGNLTGNGGALTIEGDDIEIGGLVSGSGSLVIRPLTPSQGIVLGGTTNTTSLDLSSSELSNLADGFTSITIGRSDGSGSLILGGNIAFKDPVTLQMPSTTGNINTTGGSLTAAEGLTLLANGNIVTGTTTVNGGDLDITSQAGTVNVNNALTNTGTGAITITGNSSSSWGIVTNTTTGSITSTGGAISLAGSSTALTEGLRLNSPINSNGGAVTLTGTAVGTGVWIVGNGGVTTGGGSLSITGTNTGSNRWGLLLNENSLGLNTGGGNLTLQGITAVTGARSITLNENVSTGTGTLTVIGDRLITIGNNANPTLLTGSTIEIQGDDSLRLTNATLSSNGTPLTLNSDRDSNGSGAILLTGSSLQSGGGHITLSGGADPLTGFARSTPTEPDGLLISTSTVDAAGGNITLRGTSSSSTAQAVGVELNNSRLVTSGVGTLTLFGNGGNGDQGQGILLSNGSSLESENGAISLTGEGGAGLTQNYGIFLQGDSPNTFIRSINGEIRLTGTSRGIGAEAAGIRLNYLEPNPVVIETTGTGNITLNGTGSATGTEGSDGIAMNVGSQVLAKDGTIVLTGTGQGSNFGSEGIELGGISLISTSGTGSVQLTGTGGSTLSQGIWLQGGSSISTNTSGLSLTGNTLGSGTGILLSSGSYLNHLSSTATGPIVLDGTGGTDGIRLEGAFITASGTSTLSLTGISTATGSDNNGIDLSSGSLISTSSPQGMTLTGRGPTGSSSLAFNGATLQSTAGAPITLQGNGITFNAPNAAIFQGNGAGDLILSPLDLAGDLTIAVNGGAQPFQTLSSSDFARVVIGNTIHAGTVRILGSGITFSDPLEINSGLGSIDTTGASLQGEDDATIGLTAANSITTGNLTNPGRSLTLNATGSLGTIDTTAGRLDTSNPAGNGGTLTVTSQSGSINLGDLDTHSTPGQAGTIAVTSPVSVVVGSIRADGVIPGTTITLTSDEIDFSAGSSASATENATLTLLPFTAGQSIVLGDSGDTGTGALDLTATDLAGLGNGFSAVTIGAGNLSAMTVNGAASFNDPVTFFFSDMVANAPIQGFGNASLTFQGDGNTLTLNATSNLTTQGQPILINDRLVLGASPQILTTDGGASGANIQITGTIDGTTPGAEQLGINAGSGTVQLGGAIGGTVPLGGLFINGSGLTLSNNITTQNTTGTFATIVALNAPTTVTAPITITAQQGRFVTNNTLNFGSNNTTLIVDGLRFLGGEDSVTGSGTLTLQPFNPARSIALRGLEVSDTEVALTGQSLAAIGSGFTQVNLGDALQGTGTFFIDTDITTTLTLKSPFVLQGQSATSGGYQIRTGNGNSTFTLTAQNAGFLTGDGLAFPLNGRLSFLNATGISAGLGTDILVVNTGQDQTIALADPLNAPILGTVAGVNFAEFEGVDAQGTSDQLLGTAGPDTIVIGGGSNSGSVVNASGLFNFSGIENIDTGDGDDSLTLLATGSITGTLTGGTGTSDRLDFSQQVGDLTVDLAQIGATGVEVIIGNAKGTITDPISTLRGPDATGQIVNWTVIAPINGTVLGAGLNFSFSGFNVVAGGSADDVFKLSPTLPLTIVLDGGTGVDQLDYSDFTTPIVVNLATQTASGIAGFRNMEEFLGSASTGDILQGQDTGNTFTIAGNNLGNLDNTFNFSSMENLQGGAGNDRFVFTGGLLTGTIDGQAGEDTLVADNAPNTFTITSMNTGMITNLNTGFSNIENLEGGADRDSVILATGQDQTLTLTGATSFNSAGLNLSNIEQVDAQGLNDLLLGSSADESIVFTGLDQVLISGVLQATGIETLNMDQGNDTIGILDGADLSGDWSGGDGLDSLDLSAQTGDVVVNLNQLIGFGIETIIGKASTTGTALSTIQGFDTPGSSVTWLLNPDFSGQILDSATGTSYTFIGFNQFLGGSADDRFTLTEGLTLTTLLDGGLGVDRLDYSSFTSPIQVDLATSTGTGLTGFQNIEAVTGGSSTGDGLRGLDSDNRFVLTGTNQGTVNGNFSFDSIENLQGGAGNETVRFQPSLQPVGSLLTGNIDGGSGTLTLEGDRIDFGGSVLGTGQLIIQPLSSDRSLRLGENTSNPSLLELSDTALRALQGFSGITIGLAQGNGLISGVGDLQLSSPLILQSLGLGGAIDLSGATLTTPGTAVTLQADQSIQTGAITTNGGSLTLNSIQGSITSTGTLQTSATDQGGSLSLIAPGAITTGDLNTSGNSGGNLSVQSQTAITTGAITTQGFTGRGGDVLLDPPGDVQVTYIDARGGTQGGNVSITTGSLFRATGLIPGTLDSISTAGSLTGAADGGSITIYHNGVALGEFFVVGDGSGTLTANGTLGGISSGNLRVPAGQYGQTVAVTFAGQFNTLTGLDERPNINLVVEGTLNNEVPFTPAAGCPPDCLETNTPPIDVPLLGLPNQSSVVELSVEEVETEFTDEVAEYNGVDRPPLRPLPDIQADLQAVEDATGIKPAVIYVVFTPTTVSSDSGSGNNGSAGAEPETPEKVISKPPSTPSTPEPEVLWEFSDSTNPLGLAQASLLTGTRRQTLGSDELELVLVTATGDPLRVRVAGANRSRVEQAAFLLRQEVSDPGRTGSSRYLQPSRLLYNWIIRPLEATLQEKGIDNLVFVMDSGLRSLPVAALNDGERFLIETYSAGMMPSLSLTDTRYRDIRQARLLGMGSSTFQDQSDLPTVPLELKTIVGEIWKNGEYYLNDQFTIDNLQNRSQEFGIIHLATHADFLPGNVSNSYIALSRERINIDRLREFGWQGSNPETDPPVELLTLSACKTAIGSEDAELGFAGLAVQAGVKTALASLWYVSDAATTGLMTKFYGLLADAQQAPIKAEALRQAQLAFARGQISVEGTELRGISSVRGSALDLPAHSVEVLNDRELSHPYYWASFTLVGSPW
jgi:CHAT domain-containing protein